MIESSEKLRRAMGNITHFVDIYITAYDLLNGIDTLLRLKNIKRIMFKLDAYRDVDDRRDEFDSNISAAKAKARELQLANITLQIVQNWYGCFCQ